QRDTGLAPLATPPASAAPPAAGAALRVSLRPVDALRAGDILLEAEPNDAPEQAQALEFRAGSEADVVRVIGGADDLEYFNHAESGAAPDDWYLVENPTDSPKLFTATLQMVEPVVSA